MSEVASARKRAEWLMAAQVIAAGVGAGLGEWKGIEALARALGLPVPGGGSGADEPQVRDLVTRLYERTGGTHGAYGRRTRGRAGGADPGV